MLKIKMIRSSSLYEELFGSAFDGKNVVRTLMTW
jgi:hypothetical protein